MKNSNFACELILGLRTNEFSIPLEEVFPNKFLINSRLKLLELFTTLADWVMKDPIAKVKKKLTITSLDKKRSVIRLNEETQTLTITPEGVKPTQWNNYFNKSDRSGSLTPPRSFSRESCEASYKKRLIENWLERKGLISSSSNRKQVNTQNNSIDMHSTDEGYKGVRTTGLDEKFESFD